MSAKLGDLSRGGLDLFSSVLFPLILLFSKSSLLSSLSSCGILKGIFALHDVSAPSC